MTHNLSTAAAHANYISVSEPNSGNNLTSTAPSAVKLNPLVEDRGVRFRQMSATSMNSTTQTPSQVQQQQQFYSVDTNSTQVTSTPFTPTRPAATANTGVSSSVNVNITSPNPPNTTNRPVSRRAVSINVPANIATLVNASINNTTVINSSNNSMTNGTVPLTLRQANNVNLFAGTNFQPAPPQRPSA